MAEMARHDWPGNVRELRNYVERSLVLRSAGSFAPPSPTAVGAQEAPSSGARTLSYREAKEVAVSAFERAFVTTLLAEAGGNLSKAARAAGMDRMYLHRLVQKHSLK